MADTKPHEAHLRNTLSELEDWAELVSDDTDRAALELVVKTLAWVVGDADEPEWPQPDWCDNCKGTGGWSTSVEAANGRVLDLDHECPRCGGSRVEP